MNDTLDVLRYWLPEWEAEHRFYPSESGELPTIRWGRNYVKPGEDQECDDLLCAELRRRYLERGPTSWLRVTYYFDGDVAVQGVVCADGKNHALLDDDTRRDTELLATIAAGRKLREALEPGEGT